MFNKFMKFIRRLNRENIYLLSQSFQILCLISSMEVMKKYKISAENLSNYACLARPKDTGTWGVN